MVLLLTFLPGLAPAMSLIRDAEIEDTLRAYGNPIFKIAGLNPQAIHIFIVDDPTINAYVAGGANLFLHTGLILRADQPAMLLGVMAHETGHMAGGHLAQGAEQLKGLQLGGIVAALLGAALVAGGGGSAGVAAMSAGQEVLVRNYLHFSRSNESAADQAGLDYLDALGISASGMLRLLEILRQDENRSFGTPDPYTRTHPLNIDRITHIRNHVMQSRLPEDVVPPGFEARHARMIAKLTGFTESLEQTLLRYPVGDDSIPARYARAIGYFRNAELAASLKEIDALIAEAPRDPFFHELRGQILFENGKVPEAAESYAKALALLPRSPLLLTDQGKVLLARGRAGDAAAAAECLEKARVLDDSNPDTWHYLSIAYGTLGRMGRFHLAAAEEAALADRPRQVVAETAQALKLLGRGEGDTPSRLRANDLKLIAEKEIKDQKSGGFFPKGDEKDNH